MCEVKTDDGTVYNGIIENENDSTLALKQKNGATVTLPKSKIVYSNYYFSKKSRAFEGLPGQDHVATQFHIASRNAFLFYPRRLEGSSSYFLLHHFNYTFSKHFAAGLSASVFAAPILAHLKSHFKISPRVFFGAEAYAGILFPARPDLIGAGALKLTIGSTDRNMTLIASTGNDFSNMGGEGMYAFGLAGSAEMKGGVYGVAELWAARDASSVVAVLGLRTAMKPRISWVFALGGVLGPGLGQAFKTNALPLFPYVGFSFRK